MQEYGKKEQGKKKIPEVKTISVPFALGEINENISISTNTPSKPSKELIIQQATKLHLEGNISEAAKYYRYFINQGFKNHIVFTNYGVILKQFGQLKEAEISYRKAIEINPDHAISHFNLGNILKALGKLQDAELSHRKAIKINPNFTMSYFNLGNILKALGKLQDAELSTRKAIELNPNFADAHSSLGNILRDLGNLKEAELLQRKAIEINPNLAEAYTNLGSILSDLGQLKEAELSCRKAIKINPNLAEAHNNLGSILKDFGSLEEAEVSTRKAIEINPDFADAHSNLSVILRDLSKLKEAEVSCRKAIKINPNLAEAHNNLGSILKDFGSLEESELSTRKAIEINPNFADAYFNLSLIELLKGNYQSGLKNYELRAKRKKGLSMQVKPNIPKIGDMKLVKGDKLLIVSEQGLGDTLQFMRYIPHLRTLGLDVTFSAQTKLHSLIQSSGIDSQPLTPEEASEISEGKWMPLLSLLTFLKVNPRNPIISKPYILSTDELNQKWKNLLSKEKRPIVGINWQGNPAMEKTYQGRSIPLEIFATLSELKDIVMVSLQKGFGSEQLNNCSFKHKFVKCQTQVNSTWDFLENAAIIKNCDLIITCDTAIAHLAGGMGKKVWLLLRDIPFWYWGLTGESTFWYPSMRLFRQQERHNWKNVMERVSSELQKEIS